MAVGIQNGVQDAATNDGSTAEASNELGITQNQANAGLGEIDDLDQGDDSVGDVLLFPSERAGWRARRGPSGPRPFLVQRVAVGSSQGEVVHAL